MAETKYGKHLFHNPFYFASKEFGGALMFKQTDKDHSGVVFEHHYVTDPNWSISVSRTPETHELFCFVGGNPENIMDLGAEIRLTLGADDEEEIVTDPTVVIIPPGLKHGPMTVKKFTRPFNLLRIVDSPEYQAKLNAEAGKDGEFRMRRLREGNEVRKHGKKYWMNMMRGPLYIDYEPGWTGMSIWAHHDEFSAGISLGYHCIVTPYDVRFSHSHNNHENLCFLSGDPKNPRELGADVRACFGDEKEEHTFNTPTIMSMPPGLKHCPAARPQYHQASHLSGGLGDESICRETGRRLALTKVRHTEIVIAAKRGKRQELRLSLALELCLLHYAHIEVALAESRNLSIVLHLS